MYIARAIYSTHTSLAGIILSVTLASNREKDSKRPASPLMSESKRLGRIMGVTKRGLMECLSHPYQAKLFEL